MSLRRSQRRRRAPRLLNVRQNGKRKSLPSLTENRTRSKTVRNVASETNLNESTALSAHSSDSSVIYLGTYRKIPEVIDLEEIGDSNEEKSQKGSPKLEEVSVTQI